MRTAILVLPLLLTACAKPAQDIPTQYVSPLQYSDWNCRELRAEMERVAGRVSEVGGQVDRAADNDAAKMGVGLVLFWPTLFFLDGSTAQAAEYGRLKGSFEAMEIAGARQACTIASKG